MKRSKLQTIAALSVLSMYGCGFAIDIGNPTFNEDAKKPVYETKAKNTTGNKLFSKNKQ